MVASKDMDCASIGSRRGHVVMLTAPHGITSEPKKMSPVDRMTEGLVQQVWVGQNVTFSRPPSGEWLARTRMGSDGDDLGGKGRANSPP